MKPDVPMAGRDLRIGGRSAGILVQIATLQGPEWHGKGCAS